MSYIILDDGINVVHLPFFQHQTLNRSRNVQSVRGSYSPGFTLLGDMQVDPLQIEMTGTLFEKDTEAFYDAKSRLYSALKRNPQWLRVGDRQILVGGLVSDSEQDLDLLRKNSAKYQFVVQGLKPFWEDVEETVYSQALVTGVNTIPILNLGELPVWPLIKINGQSITTISVSSSPRTLTWIGDPLDQSDWIMSTFEGDLRVAGNSAISQVGDDSLFPVLTVNETSLVVNVNGPGTIEVRFRLAYE